MQIIDKKTAYFNTAMTHLQQGNKEKAEEWLIKAATLGDAHAQCNLGVFYLADRDTSDNMQKAFQWFEKAAKQGIALAQHNL
ncbi:MAG: sel1 repeat family protein, partial [Neisseriaceae bacterium]|nr:sel1 repeat family protein [Neisseriaceae bacterium]